ncbi:MAG: hypothetical protein O3A63_21855, partial [Proteobacteria bacterium]|nr:hypothetical protein [Pseudomonadota bacterium]
MAPRIYCSEHSPEEPMLGTADVVDVWLLLEYRPTWKGRAIEEGDLSEPLKKWLADQISSLAAIGLKARPQL